MGQAQARGILKPQHIDPDNTGIGLKDGMRRAAVGGGLSGFITFAGAWFVGDVSGSEAFVLLSTALPAARSFAANILLATSTILALMLTLLSFSYNAEIKLKWAHYQLKDFPIETVDQSSIK